MTTTAADLYAVEMEKLPLLRRLTYLAASLLGGVITWGGGTAAPPSKRYHVVDRRTAAVLGEVEEGWEERFDVGVLMQQDLEAMGPEEFLRRWAPSVASSRRP